MNTSSRSDLSRLLELVAAAYLDVSKTVYEKAVGRHQSLGEWLLRPESKVARFSPHVSPQGSFRFGTVNRPLDEDAELDLDNVCVLQDLTESALTQAELKALYGEEIKAYAKAHNMRSPVTEKNRCWRLHYADEANFHLDTLPCVPEDAAVIARLSGLGLPWELARRAVAITDRRHPDFERRSLLWPSSNPRGFAVWFEGRAALARSRAVAEGPAQATIENVPPYGWKTPLQRSIQLLKRHRDVMFRDRPELAPISMIITNLAAHAYDGETDLATALTNIVNGMPRFVRADRPRVPNPADPAEDYADKWARDPRLEDNFWAWHLEVKTALAKLGQDLAAGDVAGRVEAMFGVRLTSEEQRSFAQPVSATVPAVAKATPTLIIPSAPRPWGR